jgi:ankyrin repeat protein
MKMGILVRLQVAALAVACAFLTSGCWPAHPPSAYGPVHQYAINGDLPGITAELAKAPDEVNLPEDGGLTPLHLAAQYCHTNVVAFLLDNGAKINIQATDKSTPLHLAAQEGCTDVVTLLLARDAKINVKDDQGRTPFKRAELWHQDAVVALLKAHGGTE